jgi:hypothetical protein
MCNLHRQDPRGFLFLFPLSANLFFSVRRRKNRDLLASSRLVAARVQIHRITPLAQAPGISSFNTPLPFFLFHFLQCGDGCKVR